MYGLTCLDGEQTHANLHQICIDLTDSVKTTSYICDVMTIAKETVLGQCTMLAPLLSATR